MEDQEIVGLYWARDERALEETEHRYGRYCYTVAYRILRNREDTNESVNDTYLAAWKAMPPHRPRTLSLFLAKLTRRISLNRWREKTSLKRGGGEVPLVLEELGECIPAQGTVEEAVEQRELTAMLTAFLEKLPPTERDVFVSRYWFLADVREISAAFGFSESKIKSMLHRTRKKLRNYLAEVNPDEEF